MKTFAQQQKEQQLAKARANLARFHIDLAKLGDAKRHIKAASEYRRAQHG